jgi:chromosome segregation ATPase
MLPAFGNESDGATDEVSKAPLGQTPVEDFTPNSEKVARTFDSIGQRNERLRVQLDVIEYSFRDIEGIRAQFRDALVTIDEILAEIERTKVSHLEAERKLERLSVVHERLKKDRADLRIGRDALAASQEGLAARAAELERALVTAEAAASEARATQAEQGAKLQQRESDLEDNRRALQVAGAQLSATCAELAVKENRLQLVERQCADLNDHCNLLAQENDTLRTRIEEFVVNGSRLGRHVAELKDQRDDLERRLEEAERSLAQETALHAMLKTAHLDAVEAQRLSEANLQEKFAAATMRLEAAERLLSGARATMHEHDAATRELEQRVLEKSLAVKSLEAQTADLESDLNSARLAHVEEELARAAELERSTALAKSQMEKEAALQRAEQKIARLEARFEEHNKSALGDRALLDERIAELMEQLEAQTAARLFAEGALQSARQERSALREERDEALGRGFENS